MPYTREQINKMFDNLPDDVKDAMTSVDTIEVLRGIKDQYKLHIDKAGSLSAEIAMLMLGATPPQRFISKVQEATEVDKETAKAIAMEINEKILKKVRTSLMQIHQMDEEKKYQAEKKEEKPVETPIVPKKPTETGITPLSITNPDGTKPIATQIQEETKEEPKKIIIDPYKEAV